MITLLHCSQSTQIWPDTLENRAIKYFCKLGKKAHLFLMLGGEIKTEKQFVMNYHHGRNWNEWFSQHGDSLSLKAATVEAHHKVNVTIFRECSERSGFLSIMTVRMKCQNFHCRQGLSQLMLPALIFPLNHVSAFLISFLLLSIWKEEQLLNL